jgi:hypothetical protein
MPEKVTREEKIIELAIAKAREVKALRDGLTKDEMPTIEKVKRPKAKASKHGIKQDKVHANAGGEEFTSGKIKKGKKEDIHAIRVARATVLRGDRDIEKQLAKGVLNEEETKALKQLQKEINVAYKELTRQMNMLAKAKGGFGDFKKDDRDVEFSEEQQRMADETFAALESTFAKINSEYLTSPLDKQAKMERDMREITKDLKELTMFFGRSS